MWRLSSIALASALCIAFGTGDAEAGQCTQEIENYQKELSKTDAGMGPTEPAASANETPATATMNEAAEGKATSSQDVQQQNQGQPTAADAAEAESIAPAAGGGSQVTLDQARELDAAGKEAECMAVIEKLKAE
jgi:hypothetical protein